MIDTRINMPAWTMDRRGYHGYAITFIGDDGCEQAWHAWLVPKAGPGNTWWSSRGWYCLSETADPDNEPLYLGRTLPYAHDEFLLMIVHGWTRPYGFVDGQAGRPIYGHPGGVRRERAFIIAELTGRGVCRNCHCITGLREDATIRRHGSLTTACPGTKQAPAIEPELKADAQ